MTFAHLLNVYLKRNGRSPQWLAQQLRLEMATVQSWLDGQTIPEHSDTIAQIEKLLNATRQEKGREENHSPTTHIDNRSGGVHFGGTGDVNIGGDVVGGNQTKTIFHGPVTGPIHTGSGDIHISDARKPKEDVYRPESEATPRYRDSFSAYEIGGQRLLARMGQNHSRYVEALGYQDRLRDNIGRSRRFGDTNLRQADRAEIIEQLNELSLSVIGISFNELCQKLG